MTSPEVRESYLSVLSDIQGDTSNWRYRKLLAKQQNVLAGLFSDESTINFVVPLGLQLLNDPVFNVRAAAAANFYSLVTRVLELKNSGVYTHTPSKPQQTDEQQQQHDEQQHDEQQPESQPDTTSEEQTPITLDHSNSTANDTPPPHTNDSNTEDKEHANSNTDNDDNNSETTRTPAPDGDISQIVIGPLLRLATDSTYGLRQLYALITYHLVNNISDEYCISTFLPPLLALSRDKVPNVRAAVAKVLSQRLIDNEKFNSLPEVQEAYTHMQNDKDRNVRELILSFVETNLP
jgi:DNA mismatch repair ATPase MutL